ncbi:hypothetical protein HJC23_013284 [Cyclotella cryptica]|uniref:Uncharacterized protein n=1 Tax=Cyclotella cryptica TaxID=29204 RepID=A0ABD3P8A5_9STRA
MRFTAVNFFVKTTVPTPLWAFPPPSSRCPATGNRAASSLSPSSFRDFDNNSMAATTTAAAAAVAVPALPLPKQSSLTLRKQQSLEQNRLTIFLPLIV